MTSYVGVIGDKKYGGCIAGHRVFPSYVPAGTVLAQNIDSDSVTLMVPLYRVKNGITIDLPENDWTELYEASRAGHTVSGNAYTDATSFQVPLSKLEVGKPYTAGLFSGGGSAWWSGEEQQDGMLRSVYGPLIITKVDASHVTLDRLAEWSVTDTNAGNSYGDTVSGYGNAKITSLTAY